MTEVEAMPRVERRRKWTEAERAALLAEIDAEGSVSVVAPSGRSSSSLAASGCRLDPIARCEDSSTRRWVSPLERSSVAYVRW